MFFIDVTSSAYFAASAVVELGFANSANSEILFLKHCISVSVSAAPTSDKPKEKELPSSVVIWKF